METNRSGSSPRRISGGALRRRGLGVSRSPFSPQIPFTPPQSLRCNAPMNLPQLPTRALLIALTLCLTSLVPAIFSASPYPQSPKLKITEATADQSLWRVDLRSLGYPSDSSQLQLRRRPEEFNTVDFVSENEIVASFLTQESTGLQRRNDPNRVRPYTLHALFLEAATGKLLKSLEWPLDNPISGIFPRYDGSF